MSVYKVPLEQNVLEAAQERIMWREHKKYWGSVSYAAIAGPFPSL